MKTVHWHKYRKTVPSFTMFVKIDPEMPSRVLESLKQMKQVYSDDAAPKKNTAKKVRVPMEKITAVQTMFFSPNANDIKIWRMFNELEKTPKTSKKTPW